LKINHLLLLLYESVHLVWRGSSARGWAAGESMMIFTIEKIVYCDLLLTKPDLPTVEGKEMDRLEPNDLPIRDL
jgi:hypothetical protein